MNREEKEKPNYYAVIPASVRYSKEICANAKLLYGEITALANKKGYCWASNNYFAKLYGVSKKSISNWFKALFDAGFIKCEYKYKEGSKEIDHRCVTIVPEGIEENFRTPMEEKVKENNTSNNNTINNTYISKHISEIFETWNKQNIIKHKKLTDKIKRKIKTTLKDYSLNDIVKAILHYKAILDGPQYYWTHKWPLEHFLARGLDQFIDKSCFENYRDKAQPPQPIRQVIPPPSLEQLEKEVAEEIASYSKHHGSEWRSKIHSSTRGILENKEKQIERLKNE
jgi:hypothetical protein